MNLVILKGNIGADPELKYTPSGAAVINFSIATSRKWKDKDGNQQEKTEWHRLVAWNKTAETINKWFQKGSQILVIGRIETRSWEDQNDNKHYMTEIIVDKFEFCGENERNENAPSAEAPKYPSPPQDDLPF